MGRVQQVGQSLEWRAGSRYSDLTVKIVPRERDTFVRVDGDYEGWKRFPYYVAALAAGYIGLVVSETQGPAVVGTAVLAVLGGGWAVARSVWGVLARKVDRRVTFVRDLVLRSLHADPQSPPRDPHHDSNSIDKSVGR
jgi:hypothetical protein